MTWRRSPWCKVRETNKRKSRLTRKWLSVKETLKFGAPIDGVVVGLFQESGGHLPFSPKCKMFSLGQVGCEIPEVVHWHGLGVPG